MKTITSAGPKSSLQITELERSTALEVKEQVKDVVKKLDAAVKTITSLKDAVISQRPSKDDLSNKYRGKLLRHRRKITAVFNEFLLSIKDTIEQLSAITDPEMMRLKQILVAEIGELSDGAEAIMNLLQEPGKDGFSDSLERITAQVEKRSKSIRDVIDAQLIGHIDQDILGKLKISAIRFRIMRTARIIKQLARYNGK
jgi:hypothetical protein